MFLKVQDEKIPTFQNSGLGKKKKFGRACELAENMQIPCTGIPEIKLLTFSVFECSKAKKSENFKIRCCGKKNLRIAC